MKHPRIQQNGSTLALSLACLALLAFSAAYTLRRVSPSFQQAAQFAAWQEARLAAEAGIDVALVELDRNLIGTQGGTWNGWKQYDPSTNVAGGGKTGGSNSPGQLGKAAVAAGWATKSPGNGYGVIGKALANTLNQTSDILSVLGSSVRISEPIFLDNLEGASAGNRPTNVDVQLWAVYPTPSPYYRWYRLRSMATCALPSLSGGITDSLEGQFRRYSLRNRRSQLAKDDVGSPMTVPTPNTSRIVEVLVEPVLPFQLALLTDESLSLGTSGSWAVDSYDSRDANKSASGGQYPGRSSYKVQDNGNIASNAGRSSDALYGPLIATNGALVRGGVATNGGDDPATATQESLSGAMQIDAARVRDDFFRAMKPAVRPVGGIFLAPPKLGQPFLAGTEAQPAVYLVSRNQSAFSVAPEPGGGAGSVIILVNGNLDTADGAIRIPENVNVQIYVRGDVDFHNQPINAGGRPAQLQIYGEDSGGDRRTLRAFGNASITAAFYGPQYEVRLLDNVEWFGAVAARSFEMLGGGAGGFHYDEALGMVGAPIGFRIARYIEDVRE